MKVAQIRGIAASLPDGRLDNRELARVFPFWTEEKIRRKLGIATRPIAAENETALDLGVRSAERLFEAGIATPDEIDFVVFCTQSPDHFLPPSACSMQERLGLRRQCGAFDMNLGCSGYPYGLSVCKGLIETGAAKKVLFVTAETYSKYINAEDRATRPLFGDGAAATLLEAVEVDAVSNDVWSGAPTIGPFEFGTDGSGAEMLIVPAGAARKKSTPATAIPTLDPFGGFHSEDQLFMNGPGVFNFSVDVVPPLTKRLVEEAKRRGVEIDAFVFHQANKFMLDRLRDLCGIDEARFFNDMAERGNTVSSSVPIAMIDATVAGMLKPGSVALLVGFGVGLSWGACFVRLPKNFEIVPIPGESGGNAAH